MPKKKYTVQTPLQHDGKDFAPGESVELDIPENHYLLNEGVVADGKAIKSRAAAVTDPVSPVLDPVDTTMVTDPATQTEGEGA